MSKPEVLMQMWNPHREFLIQQHRFYVNEARSRLMSQFENINADADEAAEAWLERRGKFFDPDRDDEGSIYEEAEGVAIEFYRQLDEMREQTRLSVVAGMFHAWEKNLRKWITDELRRWRLGPRKDSSCMGCRLPEAHGAIGEPRLVDTGYRLPSCVKSMPLCRKRFQAW